MVTVAAALEAGAVEPDTLIEDQGVLHFGPVVIRNADRRGMGPISVREVLAYSRNVATSKIAALLGESTDEAAAELHAMWQRLGLGRPTGVEVANEAGGLMADPQAAGWRPVELANRSFGQGVAITQIQLAAAYAAMVNGGTLVRPHLVAAVDGSATATASAAQVLEPALAETLRELLVSNVSIVPEIARRTHIDGYVVGGKTGTAQYWDVELGNWARNSYNYTFSGFVGGDRPELVIVVRIHEVTPTIQRRHRLLIPEVESYDAFRRIAQGAIDVLDLAPLGGGIDEPNAGGSGEPSPSAAPTTVPPAPPAPGGGGG
jgi:cell division protein FtsI/penicillin-binding protein 2